MRPSASLRLAQLAIDRGELFPQTQQASGGYSREAIIAGPGVPPYFTSMWNYGFNLSWELDFWGRLRRAITAGEDTLEASVANYDQVVVTMLGDIAQNYVQIRTDQERIRLLNISVKTQQGIFDFISARLKAGFKVPSWTGIRPSKTCGRPRPRYRPWRSTCGRRRTASAP